METEAEFDQSLLPESENLSPTDHIQNFKHLKQKNTSSSSSSPLNDSHEIEQEIGLDDGLDPLFGEENQFSVKRVLEFDENEDGFSQDDAYFELGSGQKNNKRKNRKGENSSVELGDNKWSTKKERSKKKETPVSSSKGKEKKERKARLAQQADYQRVMRERRGVGFKPAPMVEKSISSVLEKIRQRKLEVSKKVMSSRSVDQTRSENVSETSTSVAQINRIIEDKSCSGDEQVRCDNAGETSMDASSLDTTSDDKVHGNDEQTNNKLLVDEITQSFRAPIDDTQDLFLDSERNNSPGDELNVPDDPLDDVTPSAPSLSLKFDSALPDSPDDISSDEEVSDKENIEPHPKHEFKGKSTATGDPVKAFVDEEALDDDSDNDLLHCQGNDEEDNSDMEENCDYIATDFKEKQIDREKNHLLHQQWDQQEDENRTKNLLHKLKYGTKKSEPSLLDDDDDDGAEFEDNKEDVGRTEDEDEEDESDKEVSDIPASRASTKKLKQMIPQMFTDVDDGFVSSEDEESEKRLSKMCLLQKKEMEQQSKFLSPAEEETSREVFCRIKKLNAVPETKKKPKASSIFDALLNNSSSNSSSKSSFLRRASNHAAPAPPSHRQGPSTGKSYIFGRDDSNSRSSMSLLEDTPNVGPKENQVKKSSAKFTSSQPKRSTQHREVRSETTHETSLFDILRASSAQTGCDDSRDSLVDQQTVFAAFKSVKKQVKIERRSY